MGNGLASVLQAHAASGPYGNDFNTTHSDQRGSNGFVNATRVAYSLSKLTAN